MKHKKHTFEITIVSNGDILEDEITIENARNRILEDIRIETIKG